MFKQISLENFKALRNVSLNIGTITVLIGGNGTGKSSVLQALAVLKQSRGGIGLNLSEPHVSLGQYTDIIYKKEQTKEIHIKLIHLIKESIEPLFKGEITYVYEAVFDINGLRSHSGKIESQGTTQFEGEYILRPTTFLKVQPKQFQYGSINLDISSNPTIALPLRTSGGRLSSGDNEAMKQYEVIENCLIKLFSSVDNALVDT